MRSAARRTPILAAARLRLLVVSTAVLALLVAGAGPAAAQAATSGPTTTAAMAISDSAVTKQGSPVHNSGLIFFAIAIVVIVGGALVLYLRHRPQARRSE